MDISLIAAQAVEILRPYLGVLVTAGAGAIGKDVWSGVKDLWGKLEPEVAANRGLKTAADDVAAKPDDPDNVAALRKEIRKLLENKTELAEQLQPLTIHSGRDTYVGNQNINSPGAQIGPR